MRVIYVVADSGDCKQDCQHHCERRSIPVRQAVDEGLVLGPHQGLGSHEVAVAAVLAHDAVSEQAAGFDVEVGVFAGDVLDEPVSPVGGSGELLDCEGVFLAVEAVLAVQLLVDGSLVAVAGDLDVGDTVERCREIVWVHTEFDCFNNYNQTPTTKLS